MANKFAIEVGLWTGAQAVPQPAYGGDALTSADITLVYPMYAARDKGTFENGYPNINAWFDRIEALDSFKAARAKDDRPHIAFRF